MSVGSQLPCDSCRVMGSQVSAVWSDEGRRQEVIRILAVGDLSAVPPSSAVHTVHSLTWCGSNGTDYILLNW